MKYKIGDKGNEMFLNKHFIECRWEHKKILPYP